MVDPYTHAYMYIHMDLIVYAHTNRGKARHLQSKKKEELKE